MYDYNSVLLTGAHILLALITYFHNLYSLLAPRTSRNCYWRSCYWRSCIQSASNRFFISCHRNGEQKIYLEIYVRQRISLLFSNRHILLTGTSTVTWTLFTFWTPILFTFCIRTLHTFCIRSFFTFRIHTVIKWFREVGIVQKPRPIIYILINMWGIVTIFFQSWWVWFPIRFKHRFNITSYLNSLRSLWSVPRIKWIIMNVPITLINCSQFQTNINYQTNYNNWYYVHNNQQRHYCYFELHVEKENHLIMHSRDCMWVESAAGSSNDGVGVMVIFRIRVQLVISIGSLKWHYVNTLDAKWLWYKKMTINHVAMWRQLYVSRQEYLLFRQSTLALWFITHNLLLVHIFTGALNKIHEKLLQALLLWNTD